MKGITPLASALVIAALSFPAMAQDSCSVDITANDAMQFSTKSIDVSQSCEEFTVKLTHTGQLAKNVMGHNWVLTNADDLQGVATDGMSAGLDNNYINPDDTRVIAATAVVGSGEETSVTFPVSKLSEGTEYKFFCSFPGHFAVMQGAVNLVP